MTGLSMQIEAIFKETDKDGSGLIEYEEFKTMVVAMNPPEITEEEAAAAAEGEDGAEGEEDDEHEDEYDDNEEANEEFPVYGPDLD